MPNDQKNSLTMSAWRGALVVLGIVVVLWLAVKLLEQIWVVLLIVAIVVGIVVAVVFGIRWWRQRRW